MSSRIDQIGQNGGDGTHYLVVDVAKRIQSSHMTNARYDVSDFIGLAIEVVEMVRDAERGNEI